MRKAAKIGGVEFVLVREGVEHFHLPVRHAASRRPATPWV